MGYKLTRIAPTPSGFLHLGNIFSFAITAGMARRSSAEILLRVDDLDRGRVQREYMEDIFDTLRFMEIPWDRGPRGFDEFEREYSQVHRLSMYRGALERLREAGVVFACDCSRAQVLRASRDGGYAGTCRERGLSLDADGVSWRLRTEDVAGDLPVEMRDFVVRKKDGFPAYQLSSVVDDLHYGVDLIVRGQDLRASTRAQLYLSYALDAGAFRDITFYHHRLLVTGAGEKLSKSAGATSIRFLRQQGLSAAEIYALIAREVVGAAAAGDAAAAGVRDWAGLAALVLDL